MKIKEDHRYYIDEYKSLKAFIEELMKLIKDKKISYMYNSNGISSGSTSYTDKEYMVDGSTYIVFDDDTVIEFSYDFFSMLYITYTKKKNIPDRDIIDLSNETKKLLCILDLDYTDCKIKDYEIESFSDEYIIDPRDDMTRPKGGDYFKEIVFHLSNNKKLCICAENAEFDGYCDIWVENNTLKGVFNGKPHKVWWE